MVESGGREGVAKRGVSRGGGAYVAHGLRGVLFVIGFKLMMMRVLLIVCRCRERRRWDAVASLLWSIEAP